MDEKEIRSLFNKKSFYSAAKKSFEKPIIKNSTTQPVYGTSEHFASSLKIPFVIGIEIGKKSKDLDFSYVAKNSEKLGLTFLALTKLMADRHLDRSRTF